MAWSYRSDLSDETYHAPGVHVVEGEKLPDTPRSAEHGEQMLKGAKEKTPKDARITEHQKFTGQDVPRVIGETEEQKKIREDEEKKEGRPLDGTVEETEVEDRAKADRLAADRQKIRMEEQQKVADEEHAKELEKIRKEEHDAATKAEKKESHPASTANKK